MYSRKLYCASCFCPFVGSLISFYLTVTWQLFNDYYISSCLQFVGLFNFFSYLNFFYCGLKSEKIVILWAFPRVVSFNATCSTSDTSHSSTSRIFLFFPKANLQLFYLSIVFLHIIAESIFPGFGLEPSNYKASSELSF